MSELGEGERRVLLALARQAIEAELQGEPPPPLPRLSSALARAGGAFVSLHIGGDLRGCIGSVEAIDPLAIAVARVAVSAAHDRRFPPLRKEELAEVDIEVSVLSALEPIRPEDVEVGRHGLLLEWDHHRGLLLPQVPLHHGWDRATFLDQLCRKSGLPPGAWRRPDATLLAFTAEVFGEGDAPSSKR